MAAGAATLVLVPDHRSGMYWPGFHVVFEDVSGFDEAGEPTYAPRDLTDYDAHMQMRDALGTVLADLTLDEGLEIPDPQTGELRVLAIDNLVAPAGRMVFDVVLRNADLQCSVELDGYQHVIEGVTTCPAPV